MRTAILAVAALGLTGFVASANAAPAYQQQTQIRTAQACPAGYYWSLGHYDRFMQFWPTGCVPNNL